MKQLLSLLAILCTLSTVAQPYMSGKDGARIVISSGAVKAKTLSLSTTKKTALVNTTAKLVASKAIIYSGPIIIKEKGTYSGNYSSPDANTPAIQVWTNDSVTIINSNIISTTGADLIKASGGTRLGVIKNNFIGGIPTDGNQAGRALNDYHPKSLTFENNTIEHTGGLLVDHTDAVPVGIFIRYNIIRNTDKRDINGNAKDHRAGVLFNTVPLAYGEIAWNQFINILDSSHIEDNINLYNSGGTAASIYKIHDNYIKGAYPYPAGADFYTGSGITIDGDPGTNRMDNMSQFVNAYNNQVISTCNAAMNIAAGHDIHFYNNTMISSGMFANGTKSDRFWGGCAIWNASNVPAENFINNDIKNNVIGYVRPLVNMPLPGRQDWVYVNGTGLPNVQPGDNTSLPNPITLATEDAEWTKWQSWLAVNKIVLGSAGTNVTLPNTDTVVVTPGNASIKVKETMPGKVSVFNIMNTASTFKDILLTLKDSTIVQVDQSITDVTSFTLTGLKSGSTEFYVTVISNAGVRMSKTIQVTVTADLNEAVGFNVILPYKQ